MTKNKILHIMILDKFLAPFIDFVDEHFGRTDHHYVFITSEKYDYGLTPEHKVEFLYTDDDIFITLLEYMKISKKIILHGLWRDKVDVLLYFNKKLLKKCYWVMWGGDFYFPENHSKIRHYIIQKIAYIISDNFGDIDLSRKWYQSEGKAIACFIYPSNLYKNIEFKNNIKCKKTINILLGNSATKTNLHFDTLKILLPFKDKNIRIYSPLSYGDSNYALEVIKKGKIMFKNKFIGLTKFMTFDNYIKLLNKIDIAIFNTNRQQACGNIITLLGLGKKVYINNEISTYKYIKDKNIAIFNIKEFNLTMLDEKIKSNNISKTKEYFSEKNLKKNLSLIFNEDIKTIKNV